MEFPTSVWDDPAPLVTATTGLQHMGSFAQLAGPLNPRGTAMSPSQLTRLHNQLGPAAALPLTEPPALDIPPAAYNAYRATARSSAPMAGSSNGRRR